MAEYEGDPTKATMCLPKFYLFVFDPELKVLTFKMGLIIENFLIFVFFKRFSNVFEKGFKKWKDKHDD